VTKSKKEQERIGYADNMETTVNPPSELNPLSISNKHQIEEDDDVPLTSLHPLYDEDEEDDDVLLPPPSWIFDCFEQQRNQSGIVDAHEQKEIDNDDDEDEIKMKIDERQSSKCRQHFSCISVVNTSGHCKKGFFLFSNLFS